MAATYANVNLQVDVHGPAPEGLKIITADVTGDASYPTGGYAGVRAGLGADSQESVVGLFASSDAGYLIEYDKTNDKLKFHQQPGTAAAGPSPEVPAATNLSAVTVHVVAFVV